MSDYWPQKLQLNHNRKTLCAEDNSPVFLRWWNMATAWCLRHRTEIPPDYDPSTNPGPGQRLDTRKNSVQTRLPYYRDSEEKVYYWPNATPDGVELSDNGIFWAILTNRDRPSSRWSHDFDWTDRVNCARAPKGPAIVIHHHGWWVPVIGRYYALIGEGTDYSWLVHPEYPFWKQNQSKDLGAIWLGLVIPSEDLLKKAIVYTVDDIPYNKKCNIRMARSSDDLALWLEENSLVRLRTACKARAQNAGKPDANITLPNESTLWTLTGIETDYSLKMKTYYVTQKNTVQIRPKTAGGKDNNEIDTKEPEQEDDIQEGRSPPPYDQVDLKLLAPLMSEKFLPFLPLIADIRQTKHVITESIRKHSQAKDAMADAMDDLESDDQTKLLKFVGMTADDLTTV